MANKTDYKQQRNMELYASYINAYSIAPTPFTAKAIYQITINTPCSRFWISPENAYRIIYAMKHGTPIRRDRNINKMLQSKKQMIKEIINRCNGDFSKKNIENIVFSPAQKFYLTQKSAQVIISNIRKCKK